MGIQDDNPQNKIVQVAFVDVGNSNAQFTRTYVFDECGDFDRFFDIDADGNAYTVTGPIQKENSGTTVLDVTGIETVTTLVDNGNGTFTYTNEDATSVTVSVFDSKAYWHGKGGAAQTTNSTTPAVTNIVQSISSSASIFSLAANVLTVNKAGDFLLTFTGTSDTQDGGRRGMLFDLFVNGTKVNAEAYTYSRNNATGQNSASNRELVTLASGDTVEIRHAINSARTAVTVPSGISLTVEEK